MTTVAVRTGVECAVQKLVEQVSVGGIKLDTVEPRSHCVVGSFHEITDDSSDFESCNCSGTTNMDSVGHARHVIGRCRRAHHCAAD